MKEKMNILLVEDEDTLREFVSKALVRNGYEVSAAASAKEAQEIFEKEGGAFHLVFSDVVLPDETGLQLADRLLSAKPDLPVLLTSGYMNHKSRWPRIVERGFRFLQKPYSIRNLLRYLRDVLEVDDKPH